MEKNATYQSLYYEQVPYGNGDARMYVSLVKWYFYSGGTWSNSCTHYVLTRDVDNAGENKILHTVQVFEPDEQDFANYEASLIRQAIARFDELKAEYFEQ